VVLEELLAVIDQRGMDVKGRVVGAGGIVGEEWMVLVEGLAVISQRGLNHGGQENAWMLVIVLAVDLPRKVDVEGWGVLLVGISIFKWVVVVVQYGCRKREGTGCVGSVLNRDQVVPC